jgi:hypothetical protein
MLRRVALIRINVSEERSSSIIRVARIGEIGRTLAVTSNTNLCSSYSKINVINLIMAKNGESSLVIVKLYRINAIMQKLHLAEPLELLNQNRKRRCSSIFFSSN